ncbi:MAG: hypothetical protein HDS50_01030 [Bacteroides sp.]|nr:hypothetical protein [Bacteroides sp.]
MENKIKAYKGFNKDLTCRGFQYEVGKEYEHNGKIEACESGFHACENPFDVLNYYDDVMNNRYCEVEQSGEIKSKEDKIVSSKIKIKAEISLAGLFKAGIEWLKEVTNPDNIKPTTPALHDNGKLEAKIGSSGYSAKIGSSGDSAQIGSSGYSAKIGSSGDSAKIDSTGEDSVICCAGNKSIVKAKVGSWITLAEWIYSDTKGRYVPKCVKTEYVDGTRLKADTWYQLKDGEFVEAK